MQHLAESYLTDSLNRLGIWVRNLEQKRLFLNPEKSLAPCSPDVQFLLARLTLKHRFSLGPCNAVVLKLFVHSQSPRGLVKTQLDGDHSWGV